MSRFSVHTMYLDHCSTVSVGITLFTLIYTCTHVSVPFSLYSNADEISPIDKCSQYDTCDECISSDPDCQWCPFEPVSVHTDYTYKCYGEGLCSGAQCCIVDDFRL